MAPLPTEQQELRRAVGALDTGDAALKVAMSLAGFGVITVDYLADTLTLDTIAAALFSLPAKTAVSRAELHGRIHPDCADRLAAHIAVALDPMGGGFMTVDHQVLRPDRSVVWVAARKQVAFAGTGRARHPTTGLVVVRDITAHKRSEDRVRVSEIRYRRLFEAAHDGVLLVDPETEKIVDANPFMTRLLGYSHEELVGKELFEIGLLKDHTTSQDMVTKLKTDQHVRYDDLPLESNTGQHRDVEVVANLYDEDGHAIIQCNIRDITQRKLTEAAALQNSRLFASLIERAPNGVYVIDAAFRVLQVNGPAKPAFASVSPLIGRDFAEVLGIVWGPLVGREIEAIFRHTLATGKRYTAPSFTATRDDTGQSESYDWEIQRVIMADLSYGVVCYFNDITERKRTESIVLEREAHVRSILDNTQAFIGLLSIDGTLLEANVPALAAAGISRERVIGRKLWDTAWWSQDPSEVVRLKDAVARSAKVEIVRYDMALRIAESNRMDIDFMLAPVRDASGMVTLLVPSGLDITARKQSMAQIQLLMAEINHRAMNLLGVVQAVARQTARDGDPVTFVTRLTERIGSLAASQDLLVQNQWQGVEVVDLIAAQLSHYKDLIGTRVVFEGPLARLTPAAAQGIGMALHELATNAGKYGALSNEAGHVQISWVVTTARPPMFEMRWIESNGPRVKPPARKGFGQKVIGPMAEAAVNGSAETDHRPAGLTWTLIAPVADALERGRIASPLGVQVSHAQP